MVYDYDLESSSGLYYRYVYEDPMPVNEAGGYVFKVVDSRDVYLNFKEISYVVNDTIVDVSDFEVSLEAVPNNTIEDGYVEDAEDDELYVKIEEIRFTTKDGKQYFNKDILLEFDLK